MVNDLVELLRQNVAAPPPDEMDLTSLVGAGRRRVRTRRLGAVGAAALGTAGVVAAAVLLLPSGTDRAAPADRPPAPDAPTLHLAQAQQAVTGRDYRELASYTNKNLDRDNGQYFDGVTDDGLILFRDGPRSDQLWPQFYLMDPATGEKDLLPTLDIGQTQTWPLDLGSDRLVLLGMADGSPTGAGLRAYVFDRTTREWSGMRWQGLPDADPFHASLGPDGRLYVSVPATQGKIPEGGWPTGPDGEADDADAQGDTYELWSVSLTDKTDVRDEGLSVGDVAFTDSSMVWTDSTNGAAGLVHVRDLATGEEHSFDPDAGDRCNLLSFGATADRIVMGEYCGTYDGGVRDDRVQILSTDGDQVVTVQDSDLESQMAGVGGQNDLVAISAYQPGSAGTYVYDLRTDRLLRLSDDVAKWGMGGPAPADQLLWSTPVNHGHGATERLGEVLR